MDCFRVSFSKSRTEPERAAHIACPLTVILRSCAILLDNHYKLEFVIKLASIRGEIGLRDAQTQIQKALICADWRNWQFSMAFDRYKTPGTPLTSRVGLIEVRFRGHFLIDRQKALF
jgi:hypothetical protein